MSNKNTMDRRPSVNYEVQKNMKDTNQRQIIAYICRIYLLSTIKILFKIKPLKKGCEGEKGQIGDNVIFSNVPGLGILGTANLPIFFLILKTLLRALSTYTAYRKCLCMPLIMVIFFLLGSPLRIRN